jgi:putative ABC transport system permease protein
VIVAAAFATSARRQLTTIGQLSANGAPPSLVRRTLALQGSWSGLAGGAVGVAGAVGFAIAGRPLVERLAGRDIGPTVVSPVQLAVVLVTAVVIATVAALVPARSASRIPVMAALAGRRPLGVVPPRLVPIGLVLFLAGLGLLAASAATAGEGESGHLVAAVAVVGGLAVLAGMCCATPLAVSALRRIPTAGSWRLATRGLVRQRTRSAAVVTAIATVGATAIAVATAAGRVGDATDPIDVVPMMPADAVLVVPNEALTGRSTGSLLPESYRADLLDAIPGAQFDRRRVAFTDRLLRTYGEPFVVADPPILDAIGLDRADTEALERVGILAMHGDAGPVVSTATGRMATEAAPRRGVPESWGGLGSFLITPARAEELGWAVVDHGAIVRSPAPLTNDQRDAIESLDGFAGESPWVADRSGVAAASYWALFERPPSGVSESLVELAIVAAALLLTLVVVAIGLALAASEGRDERDVLFAVGARPSTMRRLAACRAIVLTVVAGVLAVPTGYLPLLAVFRASYGGVAAFPWLTAAGILVMIPVLAAGAAWAASAAAQRARPVRMSNLAVD